MGKTEMGNQSSKSTGKSSSFDVSYLSSLAKTQEDILAQRNQFFESYFLPEFKDLYSSMDPDSSAGKAQMGLTANQINQSFNTAQKQTNQILAQRNLADSGAAAALTAQNNRARASALANAYATQMANSNANKSNTLASLGSLMPQTTTAAPNEGMSASKSESQSESSGVTYGSWSNLII